jgi:hypothetical protein
MSNDLLASLQSWYRSQCDGDWEHQFGVRLRTLDNPGWRLEVDLSETSLEEQDFNPVEIHRNEQDWLVCRLEANTFRAYCGPENLLEALKTFIEWSRSVER